MPSRPRGVTANIILALLVLHFGFCIARWPAGSIVKRATSISEHEQLGASSWHYRHYDEETRSIATWLAAHVPEDEAVLFAGRRKGAMQLLAPLLFPRLLVEASARRGDRDSSGRTLFTGHPPWTSTTPASVPVVVGKKEGLRLEFR